MWFRWHLISFRIPFIFSQMSLGNDISQMLRRVLTPCFMKYITLSFGRFASWRQIPYILQRTNIITSFQCLNLLRYRFLNNFVDFYQCNSIFIQTFLQTDSDINPFLTGLLFTDSDITSSVFIFILAHKIGNELQFTRFV